MRIALLTTQWPGARMGGIGSYTHACARTLAEHGHEPHVFTFTLPHDVRRLLPAGVHLHEVADLAERVVAHAALAPTAAALHAGGSAVVRLASAFLLCQTLRDVHAVIPFDMVEAPEYEALGLPLMLQPIAGLPVVTHLHSGSAINRLGNPSDTGAADRSAEALEFASILAADGLCAPSVKVAALTSEFVSLPSAPAIVPLPVDFLPVSNLHPPRPDGPVLFIGRLERLKGTEILTDALPKFLNACPTATLKIIGPDTPTAPSGKSMQQWMLAQLPPALRHRVIFLGQRDRSEINEELSRCSFLVIPSLYESFSLVCAEAMSAGRTAIVSCDIGTAELIGNAGVLFPHHNAAALAAEMIALYNDPQRLAALSHAALHRAQEVLAPAHLVARRIAFYETVIHQARTDARPFSERIFPLPPAYVIALFAPLAALAAYLAGIPNHVLTTPGTRLLKILDTLSPHGSDPISFRLYGAGRHTARLLGERHLWESRGHRLIGLIDDHARFTAEPHYLGLPVESLTRAERAVGSPHFAAPVILSTDTFQEQFWTQTQGLRRLGISIFRLYD